MHGSRTVHRLSRLITLFAPLDTPANQYPSTAFRPARLPLFHSFRCVPMDGRVSSARAQQPPCTTLRRQVFSCDIFAIFRRLSKNFQNPPVDQFSNLNVGLLLFFSRIQNDPLVSRCRSIEIPRYALLSSFAL